MFPPVQGFQFVQWNFPSLPCFCVCTLWFLQICSRRCNSIYLFIFMFHSSAQSCSGQQSFRTCAIGSWEFEPPCSVAATFCTSFFWHVLSSVKKASLDLAEFESPVHQEPSLPIWTYPDLEISILDQFLLVLSKRRFQDVSEGTGGFCSSPHSHGSLPLSPFQHWTVFF